jgi:dTMP kinase
MFITFEGVEGVGKTTHLKSVAEYLQQAGMEVLVTREPGGTQMGDEIRTLVLKPREEKIVPIAELFLMFAARAQHIETVIKPALARGQWVLCDRFVDSSYAYQGAGRGINPQIIAECEGLIVGDLKPNYTWIFDAPAEIGLSRISNRAQLDRIESEKIEFFNRVRDCFLALAKANPKRYTVIDGSKSLDQVRHAVIKLVERLIHEYSAH